MVEGLGGRKRFSFRVTAAATVTLESANAAAARHALGGMLDGATAKVTTRTGAVVELVDVSVSRDAVLVLIDGVDPVASVQEALASFRQDADSGE